MSRALVHSYLSCLPDPGAGNSLDQALRPLPEKAGVFFYNTRSKELARPLYLTNNIQAYNILLFFVSWR